MEIAMAGLLGVEEKDVLRRECEMLLRVSMDAMAINDWNDWKDKHGRYL